MQRNHNFSKLSERYLFLETKRRAELYLEKHSCAKLISLSVGNTSEPLPQEIAKALSKAAEQLGTLSGYIGYGPEQGIPPLREAIAKMLYDHQGGYCVKGCDIFVSDGAKCDIGRLQLLFGSKVSAIIQNPGYPVYTDGSKLQGVDEIISVACIPENQFCPDWNGVKRGDLIYWCSPNNPTGAVSTHKQLRQLVDFAKKNRSIIIFDAAYAGYIKDKSLPRTIYEIEGAEEVALELNSFSKLAGFTGVRLGWTVVPSTLKYDDGSLVRDDWLRLMTTVFNGASNIAQLGALSILTEEGMQSISRIIDIYMNNAKLIKETLVQKGYEVYGGDNAPYLWVKLHQMSSWEAFDLFLEKAHLITTPGIGFGQCGEGFLRLSAFNHKSTNEEAVLRLKRSF